MALDGPGLYLIESKDMRNIRCPHYSGCLDAALELNYGFECSGCLHVDEEGPIDPAELEGAALLLLAIFDPKI